MPDIVKFSKGNSGNLPSPSSDSVGTFLFEEDTGNAYINVSSTSQVQIKDDTKVPLEGNSTVNGNITLSGSHILTSPVVNAAVIHGQSLAIDTIEPDTANKLVLAGGTSNTVEVGSNLQVDGDISGTLSNALTIGSKTYNNSSPTSVELSDLGAFSATASTLSAGSQATVSVTGTQFTFGIPRGNTGDEGPQGPQGPQGSPGQDGADGSSAGFGTPTYSTSTGAAGSNASVTVTASGPNTAKIFDFDFTIPRGDTGANGTDGQDGEDGGYWIPSVSSAGVISWTASKSGMGTAPTSRNIMGPQGPQGEQGPQGAAGEDGADGTPAGFGTPTASATTLSAGSSATASVTATGRNTSKVFNFTFGIPRGADGADGQDGQDGLTTSVNFGGTTYTQSRGTITIPTSAFLNQARGDARYLQLTGGTLSGNLTISGGHNVNLNGKGQVIGLSDPADDRDAVPYYMFQDLQDNAVTHITPWTVHNLVTVAADGSLIAEVPQSTFLTQTTADNRYARSSSEWTTGYLVGINAAGQLFGSIPVVRTLTLSNTDAVSRVTVTISTSYTGLSSSSIRIPTRSSVTIPIISSNGNFVMIFSGTTQLDSDQGLYGVSRSGSTYTITGMVGTVFLNHPCLTGDTLITMADGSIKRLDEIVLGEEVLHFDFSTKSLVPCKVIRLDNEDYRVSDQYDKFIFSDGTEIKAVNSHYFYNYDHKHMVDIFKWNIGDRAYSQNGELISLVSRETVSEQIRYYNIVVDSGPVYGTNYFANGLMSGDCANGDSNHIHTYFEELDVF